jgi:periplasmic protein TonB
VTIAADRFENPGQVGIVRWTGSLLIVLAIHAGLALIVILRQLPTEPVGMPPTAVMINLAPLPAPAVEPQVQMPPPEPEPQSLPSTEPPLPKLERSPAPHPPVTLPTPQPRKQKPKAKLVERPPAPQREAAPAPPVPAPAVTAPPTAPQSAVSTTSSARISWQAQLLAWLEKYKRYPRVAQEQRQQGVVYLRFAIDRRGKVLSSQINRSSGFELLDDEVLALIQRAQPLPSPPAEITGDRIELEVPVAFSLRR